MRLNTAFWAMLAAMLIFWQPGLFMNDETLQLAGFEAFTENDFQHDNQFSPGVEHITVNLPHGSVATEDGQLVEPIGSTMLNVLALPIYFVMNLLAAAIGLRPLLSLATFGVLGYAAMLVKPGWDRRKVAAGALALSMGGFIAPDFARDPYAMIASLQLVNLLLTAFAGALIALMVAKRFGDRAGIATALVFCLGTPALYWAFSLKYHGVGIALGAIALYTFRDGLESKPFAWALTTAVIGLAIWNQFPHGALLLGGWGLLVLLNKMSLKERIPRYGAAAAGLVIGVIPELMERVIKANLGVKERFVQVAIPGATSEAPGVVDAISQQTDSGYLAHTIFSDFSGAIDAYWQVFVWPNFADLSSALPILALFPLLAFWTKSMPIIQRWGYFHVAGMIAVMGTGVLSHGAGLDPRQAMSVWPFLAIGVSGALVSLEPLRKHWKTVVAVPVVFLLLVQLPLFLVHNSGGIVFYKNYTGEFTTPFKTTGLLLFVFAVMTRLGEWRKQQVIWGLISFSVMLQAMIQFGPARSIRLPVTGPFILWPVDIIATFMEWFTYTY